MTENKKLRKELKAHSQSAVFLLCPLTGRGDHLDVAAQILGSTFHVFYNFKAAKRSYLAPEK